MPTDFDLRKHPPRGPAEQVAGLYMLGRTIDKARAKLAGTLGPYKIAPGLSGYFLEWLGIEEADFLEAVRTSPDDAAIAAWLRARSDPNGYDAINARLLERAVTDPTRRRQMMGQYPILRERSDLERWFDILVEDDQRMYDDAKQRGGMDARFVMFSQGSGRPQPGVILEDRVRPMADVADLAAFITLSQYERDAVVKNVGAGIALSEANLHAPLRPSKNVFCVGRNYLAHVEEAARARGADVKVPTAPTYFTKAPTALADPGATLRLSDVSLQWDWEAELAVVIGTRCRDVPEDDVYDVIFGYTCLNDVSARDLQSARGQWFKGKSLDDSCPIGPWIVPAYGVGDPQGLDVTLRVNGVVKQHASTKQMIFSIKTIVSDLSRGMTLEPGDVIATGTPEGVGFARQPPEFLKDGDTMEVEIEKIGILRNGVALGQLTVATV